MYKECENILNIFSLSVTGNVWRFWVSLCLQALCL